MTEPTDDPQQAAQRASRRRFLAGAAGLAAAGAAGAARADNAKNLPPNVAGWSRQLGDGVVARDVHGHVPRARDDARNLHQTAGARRGDV